MEAIAHLNSALAGRYEIEREIGAGGMATVYLARDLKHERRVALKVLSPDLGAMLGPERFLEEIRVTANLQHPNILPLFDSGEARLPDENNGTRLLFSVMPYVDGESLRARLTRERQLPVDEAVRIALAAAHALQYAHEHGVIHRDVKPENILLQAGQPVVADFGIALAVTNAGGARLTQTGISLGTPQYMSPEQATGERTVDGRSDIYSLATVLYEMLTGEPPHTGSTAQAVIARLLTEKAGSARARRTNVPPHVDMAIERALEKLPADRFASAGEFAAALQLGGSAARPPAGRGVSPRAPRLMLAGTLFAAGIVVGAVMIRTRDLSSPSSAGSAPTVRASIALPTDAPLALANLPPVGFNGTQIALAPDGSALAWVATTPAGTLLYVREIATGISRALHGTEGVKIAFFSPDGAWIGFVTPSHIKKIPRAGGAAIELCAASTVAAWWPQQEFIYYDFQVGNLMRVSSEGGTPERLLHASDVGANEFSDILPGGQTALAQALNASIDRERGNILLADLRSRRTTVLVRSAFGARYVPGGYLTFARAGELFAVKFDATRGTVSGDPVRIASGVSMESAFGMLQASSASGMLAYVPGDDISRGKLAWADRHGGVNYVDAPELVYGQLDLAPDDRRIAVHVSDVQDYLWIWDPARHEGQRAPHTEAEGFPRWSRDGRRLTAMSLGKPRRVTLHDVDQSGHVGNATTLPDSAMFAAEFSPSGDVLAVTRTPRAGFIALRPGVAIPPSFPGGMVTFSPDGKWIAIVRAERGVPEIYIRSYADGREIGKVSPDGGIEPRWKPSGVLFYRNGHRWYETKVTTNPEPHWDPPHLAFDVDFIDTQGISYDVTRDGQRLLVVKRDHPMQTSEIALVTNWTRLLAPKP
jgi:serine/threonine-protein kinase